MPIETRSKAKDMPGRPSRPRMEGDPVPGGKPSLEDIVGLAPEIIRQAVIPAEDRDPEDMGFIPTIGMVEVKAMFWSIVAHDASLLPDRIDGEQLQLLLGDRRIKGYLKRADFLPWLRNKHTHAAKADALYDKWLGIVEGRMRDMSDKDIIALGKLLAEVAKKMPERWMKEKLVDADVAKMDDQRLIETILTTARNLGWTVTIPDGAPGSASNPALPSTEGS